MKKTAASLKKKLQEEAELRDPAIPVMYPTDRDVEEVFNDLTSGNLDFRINNSGLY